MEKAFLAEGKLRCQRRHLLSPSERSPEIAARQSRVGGRGRADTKTAHAAYPAVQDTAAEDHQHRR